MKDSAGQVTRFCFFMILFSVSRCLAEHVELQNGTATYSQGGGGFACEPDEAIDGCFGPDDRVDGNGWTIAEPDFLDAEDQALVFETVNDVSASRLTFSMYFNHFNEGHLLGRFRLSITSDDRSTFADGLPKDGDVDANWHVLENPVICIPDIMKSEILDDKSILVQGKVPDQIPGMGTYHITFLGKFEAVTGIRLEVLEHPDLPVDGPGLFPTNGNFVLTEIVLDANHSGNSLLGDLNNDGDVNLLDVAPFASLIGTNDYVYEADTNSDCRVDLLDVTPFIELLSGK